MSHAALRPSDAPSPGPAFVPRHDYLVVFRSGPGSLHERLLDEDPRRNWDCCVNWWGPPRPHPGIDFETSDGLNKLEGFARLLETAEFLGHYRYVLLADDDVDFRPGDISRLFEICDRHGLYLSQPALRWSSNVNHVVTARNPLCEVRRVSFVEVMTPCFSARAIADLAHTFELTRSTLGIDLAWSSLLRDRGLVSVVDAVAVDHVKPVDVAGGAFYRKLRAMGIDPVAESLALQRGLPSFGATRTLRGGHVYAGGVPAWLGAPLVAALEVVKEARFATPNLLRSWRDRLLRRERGGYAG